MNSQEIDKLLEKLNKEIEGISWKAFNPIGLQITEDDENRINKFRTQQLLTR